MYICNRRHKNHDNSDVSFFKAGKTVFLLAGNRLYCVFILSLSKQTKNLLPTCEHEQVTSVYVYVTFHLDSYESLLHICILTYVCRWHDRFEVTASMLTIHLHGNRFECILPCQQQPKMHQALANTHIYMQRRIQHCRQWPTKLLRFCASEKLWNLILKFCDNATQCESVNNTDRTKIDKICKSGELC